MVLGGRARRDDRLPAALFLSLSLSPPPSVVGTGLAAENPQPFCLNFAKKKKGSWAPFFLFVCVLVNCLVNFSSQPINY